MRNPGHCMGVLDPERLQESHSPVAVGISGSSLQLASRSMPEAICGRTWSRYGRPDFAAWQWRTCRPSELHPSLTCRGTVKKWSMRNAGPLHREF